MRGLKSTTRGEFYLLLRFVRMMKPLNRSFVFVVCGAEEHTNTLNFSLKALKARTTLPILVVTDTARNEGIIEHHSRGVIDVRTPVALDHHQASIWLKTSLHRYIPLEMGIYCYMDTDVVAVRNNVEDVFMEYVAPITFCSDHCRMRQFSPHAINCGCTNTQKANAVQLQSLLDEIPKRFPSYKANMAIINGLLDQWKSYLILNEEEWRDFEFSAPLRQAKDDWFNGRFSNREDLIENRDRLRMLTDLSQPPWKLLFNLVFRVIPNYRRSFRGKKWSDRAGNVLIDEGPAYKEFMATKGFTYDSRKHSWLDASGQAIPEVEPPMDFDSFFKTKGFRFVQEDLSWYTVEGELFLPNVTAFIERQSRFRYNAEKDRWQDDDGNPVFFEACGHLHDAILRDFAVEVSDPEWQHWNGGVFLFSAASYKFLEDWHEAAVRSFGIRSWKTRDQGTLIATAWRHGLSEHPTLPKHFNFIADYQHPTMQYEGDLRFRFKPESQLIEPVMMHIYHHWGDREWDVWRDVEDLIMEKS